MSLAADPNPVPAGRGLGETSITWDAGGRAAEIRVAKDAGPERVLARGEDGHAVLRGVHVGATFHVRLYVDGALADEVLVTRNFWPRPREAPALPAIDFGDLRRTTPISAEFGFDRGQPIDRYYIERFVASHRADIRGRVLEVLDGSYAMAFGDAVDEIDILDIDPGNHRATVHADLDEPFSLPPAAFDCVILTQTLPLMRDPAVAIENVWQTLRPAGVLLATLPGLTHLPAPPDLMRWRPSALAVQEAFEGAFLGEVEISTHGNPLAAAAFLFGVAADELDEAELDARDPRYDLVHCVRARRA